ncbi:hypothetical protein A2961_04960 [Candidatus Woesebacteria bacterium RIFCSPLOWO2_01_FULL_39_21]|uniref:Methyltransferase type 11 domain-containing protein n=1 Tax=Candidatus Woesebacteria bacterium RIFCSPLOWO2_01_FULL_39_21 TaxID=1802519 RepID=A0A1F8BDH4_9BACT|nr:MAG: hypothetical protein A2691_03335 [Candidatus Woesebacteria bacterium RIFCSPHIGHO2_01_FULL_39_23]OGM62094.1 MAG: hypothetical protein A2961_04960 [Candidatus Woesebacteria bacterium RIFCSPLOWO2_01_FULL_39_21]
MNTDNGLIEGGSGGRIAGPKKWAGGYDKKPEERAEMMPDKSFFNLLQDEGVIPQVATLNDRTFTLIGTCSAIGQYEEVIARNLNDQLSGNSRKGNKPLIIASDYAHEEINNRIIPPKMSFPGSFPNVEFKFITASALKLPVRDKTADIVFENLGAIFYADPDKLESIITEYDRVLKEGGQIVISKTSLDVLKETFGEEQINKILQQWSRKEISSDIWNFIVLSRKPKIA